MKKNNKGILFWVTGYSGSGKTRISKKIYSRIKKKYGPTIIFSGDDIRNIFNLKGYSLKERYETVMKYSKLAKSITSQNINVIFAVIGMMEGIRKWNRKNIKNYIEIYIKSDVRKIIKKGKKKIYHKDLKNIVGLDIKPEYPKKPHIIINNNFKKSIDGYSKELLNKIDKLIKQK